MRVSFTRLTINQLNMKYRNLINMEESKSKIMNHTSLYNPSSNNFRMHDKINKP